MAVVYRFTSFGHWKVFRVETTVVRRAMPPQLQNILPDPVCSLLRVITLKSSELTSDLPQRRSAPSLESLEARAPVVGAGYRPSRWLPTRLLAVCDSAMGSSVVVT